MSAPNRFGSNKTKSLLVFVGNLQGENGFTYISDTSARTPSLGMQSWRSIQAVTASTFTLLSASNSEGNNLNTVTLAAGGILYGSFTAITLASGSVIAYY